MKYLVDTCGWIEWLTEGKLINHFAPFLADPTQLIIPTLLQYELYKWISREKNSSVALEIVGITESGYVVHLDTNLALYSADIAKEHELSMADAIIYATSRKYEVDLITSDNHFKSLQHVRYFSKS
jgi:predicted nucleic acid-binding protein